MERGGLTSPRKAPACRRGCLLALRVHSASSWTRCSWTIGLVVTSNQVLLTAQARSVCAAFRGRPRCPLGSQVPGFTRMLAVDSQRAREDPGKRCFRDGHSQDESYHGYYLPGDRCWPFLKGSGISLPVRDNFILVPKPS